MNEMIACLKEIEIEVNYNQTLLNLPEVRFTKFKTLLSLSLTGNLPMKNSATRENYDSKA